MSAQSKPGITPTERIQALVADYLAMGDSFPLIVARSTQQMRPRLAIEEAKARGRRFDDAAKVSAFGALA